VAIKEIPKDPDAVLDYGFNWKKEGSPWLEDGETISTSEWTVPTGLTKDSDSKTDTTTTIWLSGGTVGETYRIVNEIITNQTRKENRSIDIVMVDR